MKGCVHTKIAQKFAHLRLEDDRPSQTPPRSPRWCFTNCSLRVCSSSSSLVGDRSADFDLYTSAGLCGAQLKGRFERSGPVKCSALKYRTRGPGKMQELVRRDKLCVTDSCWVVVHMYERGDIKVRALSDSCPSAGLGKSHSLGRPKQQRAFSCLGHLVQGGSEPLSLLGDNELDHSMRNGSKPTRSLVECRYAWA